MGLFPALSVGASFLHQLGRAIEVIGNNFSNLNTPGFKASRPQFASLLSRELAGFPPGNQLGQGSELATVQRNFRQGSLLRTGNPLDLAIQGQGFFVVSTPDGNRFTRDGSFQIDPSGFLVDKEGHRIRAFTLDAAGNPTTTLADVSLSNLISLPTATTTLEWLAALDGGAPLQGTPGTFTGTAVTGPFVIAAGVNNTFSLSVDGSAPVVVTVPPGTYTGVELAAAMRGAIAGANPAFAGVEVTYNANSVTLANRFQVLSNTTGEAHTITIPSTGAAVSVPASRVAVSGSGAFLPLTGLAGGAAANGTGRFDPADPGATSGFIHAVTLVDSLGTSRGVNFFFRKVGQNVWEYHGLARGKDLVGTTPDDNLEDVVSGRLRFGGDGVLVADQRNTNTGIFNFAETTPGDLTTRPAQGQSPTLDFSRVAQLAGTSHVINLESDGVPSGRFVNASVQPNGAIVAAFTNGRSREVARLALARFGSPSGLLAQGGNLFAESAVSGAPAFVQPEVGGAGRIFGETLEASNVDLAREFVSLIEQQQAFQANARVITTSDRMLDTLVGLGR